MDSSAPPEQAAMLAAGERIIFREHVSVGSEGALVESIWHRTVKLYDSVLERDARP